MARNGSFGFAEGAALCVGAKPNVPFVRLAKIELKKNAEGKKIKNIGSVPNAFGIGLLLDRL